jgi:3-mercaptopyruvate sulfurtransferase SseA
MNENRRNLFAWFLLAMGVFLLVGGLVTALLNRQASPALTATPASVEQVQRVSLQDAKAALDSKRAVFLDVRAIGFYEASHIPGAISIPNNEISDRMGELDRKAWIIPY